MALRNFHLYVFQDPHILENTATFFIKIAKPKNIQKVKKKRDKQILSINSY